MKAYVPNRIWLVDNLIEMPDHAIIEVAYDYGYAGENAEKAAALLRRWDYKVRKLLNAPGSATEQTDMTNQKRNSKTEQPSPVRSRRLVRRRTWLPTVVDALRFRAEQMNYTDQRMAKELGMQPSHYSEVLKGKRGLSIKATKKAFALGVPAEVLLQ